MDSKLLKVGIITFHRANNYGAVLQAYALQTSIEKMGYSCDIVDYRSDYLEKSYRTFLVSKKGIQGFLSALVNYPVRKSRKKAFSGFRDKFLKLGYMYNEETITDANKVHDIFFFGSDQIWNDELSNCDYNFLGQFVTDSFKLNTYAASFGKTNISDNLHEDYRRLLSRYNSVSMREKSGQELYDRITSKKSCLVMDPVFLLTAENWSSLAVDKSFKGKYILLYHLQGKNTGLMEYALFLAKKTKLPIIEMQAWVKMRSLNVEPRFGDNPNDFLGWIRDAEYIVTDSFHCTSFSVIFEKKFWSAIDSKKDKKKSRVGNLLFELGLQERILPKNITEWEYDRTLKFDCARKQLSSGIDHSLSFISSTMESISNRKGI